MKKKVLLLLLIIAGQVVSGAVAPKAVSSSEINSILASVNGEAISLQDVLMISRPQEIQAFAAFESKRLEQEIRNIRKKAVDELINRKLIIADYYKQPGRIQSSYFEQELDQAAFRMGCRSRSELRRKLIATGVDFEKFRKELEERMIYFYMLQRQGAIAGEATPQEIYEYFEKHRKELSGTETYELAMLKIENLRSDYRLVCQNIEAELAADPGRFAGLVKKYSADSRDGSIGAIEPGKMRIEFAMALKKPVVGKVYGPVKLEDGTAWIKLLKHNRPVNASFQEVQDKIKRIIENDRRKKVVDIYTENLRRNAILEYFF